MNRTRAFTFLAFLSMLAGIKLARTEGVELATGSIARRLRPARDFGDDSAGQGGGRKLHVYRVMNNNFAVGGIDTSWVAGRSQ